MIDLDLEKFFDRTGVSFFGSSLGMAVLAMIAAFVVISLIHAVARRNVIRREWLNSFWPKREL